MVFNIVVLALWLASIVMLVILVVRKFPVLKQLDVSSITEVRNNMAKRDIVEERLRRKIQENRLRLKKIISPVVEGGRKSFHKVYGTVVRLERRYRVQAKLNKGHDEEKTKRAVSLLLEEGSKLLAEQKYPEAERKFIETISLDHHNGEAYKKLGKLYTLQADYTHAIETLLFALKIAPDEVEIYCDLSEIYKKQNHPEKMRELLEKALEKEPNNPKVLDLIVSVSMERNDKLKASEYLHRLKDVNPENQKITEYQTKLDGMKL